MLNTIRGWINSPELMTKVNGWAALFFALFMYPAQTFWKESIPVLMFLSVWALVAAHWSAYQAAHGEREQDLKLAQILRIQNEHTVILAKLYSEVQALKRIA